MKEANEANDAVMVKKGNHIGKNIRRVREIRGFMQYELADKLGVKPQTVSEYESSKKLRKPTLEKIAEALEVPVDLIENFSEEGVHITNTFHAHDNATVLGNSGYENNVINPLKDTIELLMSEINYYRKQNELLKEQLYKKTE